MHARQRSAVQKTDVPQCEISGLAQHPEDIVVRDEVEGLVEG